MDVCTFIETAISVAAADYDAKLKSRRDGGDFGVGVREAALMPELGRHR
jgi:hypothetical protein